MKLFLVGVIAPTISFLFYQYPVLFHPAYFCLTASLFVICFYFYSVFLKKNQPLWVHLFSSLTIILFTLSYFMLYPKTPYKIKHLKKAVTGVVQKTSFHKTQWRITLLTPKNEKVIGIYYPPKTPLCKPNRAFYKKPKKIHSFRGEITFIHQTRTQTQLTVENKSLKILATYYKSKKRAPLPKLGLHDFIQIKAKKKKPFKRISPNKKYYHKKFQQGYTHKGTLYQIKKIPPFTLTKGASGRICTLGVKKEKLKLGKTLVLKPKKTFKKVLFGKYPRYLFAQGIDYYGTIASIKVKNRPLKISFSQKVRNHLTKIYKQSAFEGFYKSILLAQKEMDKKTYRIFQQNNVIPFLVISGLHIDIIISFLLFMLSIFFYLIYKSKNKGNVINFFRFENRFFKIKEKSLPLFILLAVTLIAYLNLIQFPQSATRAVFYFLVLGGTHYLNIKTNRKSLLMITLLLIFLVFPHWIAYPIGLLYSTLSVFAIYTSLPFIAKFTPSRLSKFSRFLYQSILLGTLISLFIAPLSLYLFHYYNLISIFINIPLSLLFFMIIYISAFASIISFIFPPLGVFILQISDSLILAMIHFLEFVNPVKIFIIYIHKPLSLYVLISFYIVLIFILNCLQKIFRISDFHS